VLALSLILFGISNQLTDGFFFQIGQLPWLDRLLVKNPIILLLDRLGVQSFRFPVATFAKQRMTERLANKPPNDTTPTPSPTPDLLSKFLAAQTAHPTFMTPDKVLAMAVSMTFAGSETTAISLSAIFYFLLHHPRCLAKLLSELSLAVTTGTIIDRPSRTVSWSESQRLPYLDACIKEAFRLHPAAGLPLERVVPKEGAIVDGRFVAGGTVVGCSAWVVQRRSEVFGERVDEFVPERWVGVEAGRAAEMNGAMFQFGAGSRTCVGRNISLLEIYKLVPSFLRRFEVSFVACVPAPP
jgi:cytochrome P450